MMKSNLYIAIDPDVDKNGCARLDTKKKSLELYSRDMAHLIIDFEDLHSSLDLDDELTIIVEAAWLTPTVWHVKNTKSCNVAAKTGYNVGRCIQRGKDIAELALYVADTDPLKRIKVVARQPLIKCWKGIDRKITHQEVETICKNALYSYPKSSSQDQRDAAILAMVEANVPLILKPFI